MRERETKYKVQDLARQQSRGDTDRWCMLDAPAQVSASRQVCGMSLRKSVLTSAENTIHSQRNESKVGVKTCRSTILPPENNRSKLYTLGDSYDLLHTLLLILFGHHEEFWGDLRLCESLVQSANLHKFHGSSTLLGGRIMAIVAACPRHPL